MPSKPSAAGSGTAAAGVELKVPEMEETNDASVHPVVPLHPVGVVPTGGVTSAKLRLMASGLWRRFAGTTSDVKERFSPAVELETLNVRLVPEPKVASVNVPLRTFTGPARMENEPL
jgi:hypothetical protein